VAVRTQVRWDVNTTIVLNPQQTRLLKSKTMIALEHKATPTIVLTQPQLYSSLEYSITNQITHAFNNHMNII
jgi:hypothetical protein